MVKQVLVMRKDLNMRKGKMVAQGAHAAIGALHEASTAVIAQWEIDGCTKICVSVNDESALLELSIAASLIGLPTYLVQDAGRTEFHGVSTYTALGIGPAEASTIDQLTKDLPLL